MIGDSSPFFEMSDEQYARVLTIFEMYQNGATETARDLMHQEFASVWLKGFLSRSDEQLPSELR